MCVAYAYGVQYICANDGTDVVEFGGMWLVVLTKWANFDISSLAQFWLIESRKFEHYCKHAAHHILRLLCVIAVCDSVYTEWLDIIPNSTVYYIICMSLLVHAMSHNGGENPTIHPLEQPSAPHVRLAF